MELQGLLVLIVLALCQAIKMAGIKGRWIPLIAIVLGILGGAWFSGGVNALVIIGGVISGMASSGLWELGSRTVLGRK